MVHEKAVQEVGWTALKRVRPSQRVVPNRWRGPHSQLYGSGLERSFQLQSRLSKSIDDMTSVGIVPRCGHHAHEGAGTARNAVSATEGICGAVTPRWVDNVVCMSYEWVMPLNRIYNGEHVA